MHPLHLYLLVASSDTFENASIPDPSGMRGSDGHQICLAWAESPFRNSRRNAVYPKGGRGKLLSPIINLKLLL